MLKIGICDDNEKDRKIIEDLAFTAFFDYDDIDPVYYSSGEEVLDAVKSGNFSCDILYMDVNMGKLNGIDTVSRLRDMEVDVDVIFVTVSKEHVLDGYSCKAFSYIMKPVDTELFNSEMKRYAKERDKVSDCLHVTINNRKEIIHLNRVYYFEGEGRKINICGISDEEKQFYSKMGDLEETLRNYGFIRCHQSYLVNRKYITNFSRNEIVVGNTPIPVSRKYQSAVAEILNS